MEVNELMIGDWVLFEPLKESISTERVIGLGEGVVKIRQFWVYMKEIKPIPLTAEILEKNGWKDISDHTLKGCETFKLHYEQRAFDFYITIKLRDYFKLESYDDRFYTLCEMEFGCRFVHQLQHALRLCGIDKEIVL